MDKDGLIIWENKAFVDSYIKMESGLLAKRVLYQNILQYVDETKGRELLAVDLGSGISTIAPYLKEMGYEYCGIDQSVVMLGRANTSNLIQGDLLSPLPIRGGSADLVIATNVLYNFGIEQIEKIVKNISVITRPGGVLLSTNPSEEADNSKIILQEWKLRGGNFGAFLGLATDIYNNFGFLREQSRLAKEATKLNLVEWTNILQRNGFDIICADNVYAGQALLVKAVKREI